MSHPPFNLSRSPLTLKGKNLCLWNIKNRNYKYLQSSHPFCALHFHVKSCVCVCMLVKLMKCFLRMNLSSASNRRRWRALRVVINDEIFFHTHALAPSLSQLGRSTCMRKSLQFVSPTPKESHAIPFHKWLS